MPTHAEQRVLPYTPEQLFALWRISSATPEFLPWCVGARVREKNPDLIVADLIIGFKMFRERFTSHVNLDPPHRIDVAYAEGPFKIPQQSLGVRAHAGRLPHRLLCRF
jgi:coenzyme Q-binding protein COQ10